jgi:hypothetical protein
VVVVPGVVGLGVVGDVFFTPTKTFEGWFNLTLELSLIFTAFNKLQTPPPFKKNPTHFGSLSQNCLEAVTFSSVVLLPMLCVL